MDPFSLVLIVLVAAAAFAAGYFIGHFKALAEVRNSGSWSGPAERSPLPGPDDGRYAEASSQPPRPRGAAPPASAGTSGGGAGTGARAQPRRSTKPPPAIAGLMGRITGKKPDDSQN